MTACLDCPDLDSSAMPADWRPRATCCRDDHLARRVAGSMESWQGIGAARAIADAQPRKNRQQRRAERAQSGGKA